MDWLGLLKTEKALGTGATKPTKPGFVGSVAPIPAHTRKFEGDLKAANDTADAGPATTPTTTVDKFRAASLALDASISAAGTLPRNDPDADCWPDSMAMTGAEIDLFTARLHRFNDKGLTRTDGEALADRLVIRDRETDDRRSCLECRHLSGFGHTSWRCGNWQAAGVAIRPRDTQLPADLVLQLQRCDGFATATPNARANAAPNPTPKTSF